MDRFTSMNIFVKTVELGSFAAAADALTLSPQMVAKYVAWLEARLGSRLLNRTTRRQSLTDVGQRYYERCKVVLAELQAADDIAREMQTTPSGIIQVNAPVTWGSHLLAPFITRYLERYPDTQIALTLNDRQVDPIEEGFEVVIRIGELADSTMVAWPLQPYSLIACASPDYVARAGLPDTPSSLVNHTCLIYGVKSVLTPCRWIFQKEGKTEEVRPKGRLYANDWNALLHAAIEGYGVTLGPEAVLRKEIQRGRLIQVLSDYDGPVRPVHVMVPSVRRSTIKVKTFVDAIRTNFG
ncbi:LysR family transcriptional regulator [Pectobacterium carotovorum]|uniref:LysR family transcriptional regulator n=1 Tax=Pectobacterium carotovorum subsp. carotovorum TaxID=555 RepID=A0AAI9L453_PECCC|nr:LysR family transcriptional regulator [Pectobacterium carotovorum]MCL6365410.1 LysR family transcriptional regulator [Pectobacterium carotovorum subsp. carotovorum]QHP60124.1 LysR family transcriptional regulator [Pectobacterium carotovorum subsp. carotovorum]ULS49106.1 LysR family transcriptional regulator [Pectobacterium carotovorum]GKX48491.1 LysR family transcriptional regulator [Pectobacterium carotovorum subsp. carotovorum]GLV70934.1 LysR family transcriptional regulator [Pectobacteri